MTSLKTIKIQKSYCFLFGLPVLIFPFSLASILLGINYIAILFICTKFINIETGQI